MAELDNKHWQKTCHAKFCMTSHAVLHGIVVMTTDSESEGQGFEYWHFQIFPNYFWPI